MMNEQETAQEKPLPISPYTSEPYDPDWGVLLGLMVTKEDRRRAQEQVTKEQDEQ